MPAIAGRLVRRRNDAAVLVMWRRAIAIYELERGAFSPSLSPNELATRATSRLYDEDPFIFELADIASRTLFGQQDPTPAELERLAERTRTYLAERRRRLGWFHRLRSRLDPITVWKLAGGTRQARSRG
jgi:hypothetical protein